MTTKIKQEKQKTSAVQITSSIEIGEKEEMDSFFEEILKECYDEIKRA